MNILEKQIKKLINEGIVENIAVCIGVKDDLIGEIYRSRAAHIDEYTKFDMASVTKILATTMVTLISLDKGKLRLTDKVADFFPCPESHKDTSVKNLLTHTMGIGHKNLYDTNYDYSNITEYILNIPLDIPMGSNVLYSCPGYILLGKILEKIYGKRLDELFTEMVADPLGMLYSSFLPNDGDIVNSNVSEKEKGIVNDYNCKFLGGVAGNAGIFSNMCDMKRFVKTLLNNGYPLISEKTFYSACENYTEGMNESRGLGFLLVDEKYHQTGKLFDKGSIGHCGHTGQSFFVDLKTGLYVIILSDMTATIIKNFGYENYYAKVMESREQLHNAIFEDLEKKH